VALDSAPPIESDPREAVWEADDEFEAAIAWANLWDDVWDGGTTGKPRDERRWGDRDDDP
jgi:hypothetical protein